MRRVRTRAVKSAAWPAAIGSKSRLTPSAPRSWTALAIWRARFRRAVELPSSAPWVLAWLEVQAKTEIVSTTRVPFWWAALMMLVSRELVQPPQPVVTDPSLLRFSRLPARSAPTEK